MTRDEARIIIDGKCANDDCWHRPESGYIFCVHCLEGVDCPVIPAKQRGRYMEALETLKCDRESQ